MLMKKRALLVAAAVCLLVAAASLAAAAQAVTANRYTLPINLSYPPGHLSADRSGKIWAGPVYSPSSQPELLAVDPALNQLTVWTHQNTGVFAPSNLRATAVDSLNRVWFGGGLANGASLVSRLDPVSGLVTGWPATPGDFAPTPQGRLWMSLALNLGLLDPATNVLTTWPQTNLRAPVASDPQGRGWFALGSSLCANAGHSLAVLDPVANTVTTWVLPTPSAPQFQGTTPQVWGARGITVDGSGKVWVAVWYQTVQTCSTPSLGSAVVVLDPVTNVMKLWPCPSGCDGFTTISLDPLGKAWLTDTGNGTSAAKIDRLDLNSNPVSFVEYDAVTLTGCSSAVPLGTVADLQGNGWSSYGNQNTSCPIDKITQLPP